MFNHRILIAGAIAAAIPLMTLVNCTSAEGADEPTGEAAVQQGIPLWTNVREPIWDDAWRYVAARYSLVFALFSPTASGKDLTSENVRVKWIKSLGNVNFPPGDPHCSAVGVKRCQHTRSG